MEQAKQASSWLREVFFDTAQELSQLPEILQGPARSEVLESRRKRRFCSSNDSSEARTRKVQSQ